jgi:hypothetical protein
MQINDDIQTNSAPERKKKTYIPPALKCLDSVEDTTGKTAFSNSEFVYTGPVTGPS